MCLRQSNREIHPSCHDLHFRSTLRRHRKLSIPKLVNGTITLASDEFILSEKSFFEEARVGLGRAAAFEAIACEEIVR